MKFCKSPKILFLLLLFIGIKSFAQNLYIPVSINAPLFIKEKKSEFQIGTKINNYGLNHTFAYQWNKKILIISIQENNGKINFDPLNFNNFYYPGQENHLIESYPTRTFYYELGYGKDFNFNLYKLSLIGGFGRQIDINLNRYFMQIDWGNESRIINAGATLRGNFALVNKQQLLTLEPMVQGKVKLGSFRIINQFGYSLSINQSPIYMKPIISIGLEYVK